MDLSPSSISGLGGQGPGREEVNSEADLCPGLGQSEDLSTFLSPNSLYGKLQWAGLWNHRAFRMHSKDFEMDHQC